MISGPKSSCLCQFKQKHELQPLPTRIYIKQNVVYSIHGSNTNNMAQQPNDMDLNEE